MENVGGVAVDARADDSNDLRAWNCGVQPRVAARYCRRGGDIARECDNVTGDVCWRSEATPSLYPLGLVPNGTYTTEQEDIMA